MPSNDPLKLAAELRSNAALWPQDSPLAKRDIRAANAIETLVKERDALRRGFDILRAELETASHYVDSRNATYMERALLATAALAPKQESKE